MKKRLFLASALVGALAVALVGVVVVRPHIARAASNHTVCASGCNFTTIQAAINDAGTLNGDTITVGPGTYNEAVIVTKSLTINGAKMGQDARTRGTSGESIVDASSVPYASSYCFFVQATGVTIDGFTLQGATNGDLTGSPADGLLVQNDIIQNANSGILEVSGTGITIQRDLFQNINGPNAVGGDAIYDDFVFQNLTITQNKILSSIQAITLIPFSPNPPPTPPVQSVTITNNYIENDSFLWDLTGSFSNNTIVGNAAVANPAGEPTLGVKLGGADQNFTVSGNTFTNLQIYAVKARDGSDDGIPYPGDSNIHITNNIVNVNVGLMNDQGL